MSGQARLELRETLPADTEKYEQPGGDLFVLRWTEGAGGILCHRLIVASRSPEVLDGQVAQVLEHFRLVTAVELAGPASREEEAGMARMGAASYREVLAITAEDGEAVHIGPGIMMALADGRLMVAVHYHASGAWQHVRVSN